MNFNSSEDFYQFVEELRNNKQYDLTEAEREALNNTQEGNK